MYVSYSEWMPSPKPAPDKEVIFAIGDVHGHAGELSALHQIIVREINGAPDWRYHVVHLGDYIDRGPENRRVLECLSQGLDVDAKQVNLAGNHDQFLIELLKLDPDLDEYFIMNWYENGGMATMVDLKIEDWGRLADKGDLEKLSALTREALGSRLCGFLDTLKLSHRIGDYVFVHAGIDPSRSLEEQDWTDLILIREPFLSAANDWQHDFCVVHGHSIAAPAIYSHRIGVDSGCYRTGAMCALQLRENQARFLAVTAQADSSWLEDLGGVAATWAWTAPQLIQ